MSIRRVMTHQAIADLVGALLQTQGFELVELQVQPRKSQWLIRVFADTEGGIGLEDCRRLSFELGQLLEAEAIVPTSYLLEVSSPGLDRPLHTMRDFQRQRQRLVKVFLQSPVNGHTEYIGRVVAVVDDHLILHVSPDASLTIPLVAIDHGVIELEFR